MLLMKIIIVLITALLFFAFNTTFAQSNKKKDVRKEVKFTEENGEKIMIIITTENGKTITETYKGKEAEAKLMEMQSSMPEKSGTKSSQKVYPDGRKEIRVEKYVIKKERKEKIDD